MRQPKQLLPIGNETLLQHIATEITDIPSTLPVAILGAFAEQIKLNLSEISPTLRICTNSSYATGIGSSIKAGLKYALEISDDIGAALIITCDQPYLTSSHIRLMIDEYRKFSPLLVASSYATTVGVPALFDRQLFQKLLGLNPEEGAKRIINEVDTAKKLIIPLPNGEIDLDTPDDYNNYMQSRRLQ